jgi:hypothetical protein
MILLSLMCIQRIVTISTAGAGAAVPLLCTLATTPCTAFATNTAAPGFLAWTACTNSVLMSYSKCDFLIGFLIK